MKAQQKRVVKKIKKKIHNLRFDPCQPLCVVELNSIKLLDRNDSEVDYILRYNGIKIPNSNTIYFHVLDPAILIIPSVNRPLKECKINVTYHAIGTELISYSIQQLFDSAQTLLQLQGQSKSINLQLKNALNEIDEGNKLNEKINADLNYKISQLENSKATNQIESKSAMSRLDGLRPPPGISQQSPGRCLQLHHR